MPLKRHKGSYNFSKNSEGVMSEKKKGFFYIIKDGGIYFKEEKLFLEEERRQFLINWLLDQFQMVIKQPMEEKE